MQVVGVDHGGLIEAVGDALARSIPAQQRVSVVHGDYRLDNTVLDDHGRVRAILDWEICTLGDPMADLGSSGLLGRADGRNGVVARRRAHDGPRFCHPRSGPGGYASHSTLDLSHVAYYQAFGYWKFACIMQGVFARYSAGAAGGDQGRSPIPDPYLRCSRRARS